MLRFSLSWYGNLFLWLKDPSKGTNKNFEKQKNCSQKYKKYWSSIHVVAVNISLSVRLIKLLAKSFFLRKEDSQRALIPIWEVLPEIEASNILFDWHQKHQVELLVDPWVRNQWVSSSSEKIKNHYWEGSYSSDDRESIYCFKFVTFSRDFKSGNNISLAELYLHLSVVFLSIYYCILSLELCCSSC